MNWLRYWMGHPPAKRPSWWRELPVDGKVFWLYVLFGLVSVAILAAAIAAA